MIQGNDDMIMVTCILILVVWITTCEIPIFILSEDALHNLFDLDIGEAETQVMLTILMREGINFEIAHFWHVNTKVWIRIHDIINS